MLDAASQTCFTGSESNVRHSGGVRGGLFRAIFGLELDGGKAWRRKSLGTGVYQPEDPWEVRERLSVYQPEDPWGGERTAYCVPAKQPVGGDASEAFP